MILVVEYLLFLSGAFFLFSAGVGLYRFKDPASRLHPPTKASVMGLVLILLGSSIQHGVDEGGSLAAVFFSREFICLALAVTVAPLAGHVLTRALRQSK